MMRTRTPRSGSRAPLARFALLTASAALMALQPPGSAEPSHAPPPPPEFGRAHYAFETDLLPRNPCLCEPVTIRGRRYRGATRAVVWLSAPSRVGDSRPQSHGLDDRPFAVKVGEAKVDALGDWALTTTFQPVMGPVTTGGTVVLQPGGRLDLFVVSDAPPGIHMGPSTGAVFHAAGSPCPDVSVPPLPSLALEPPHPCRGQRVTLRGRHFHDQEVELVFGQIQDRWGSGPRAKRKTTVAADGTFQFTFDFDEFAHILEGPTVSAFIAVRDAATNSEARIDVHACVDELLDVLSRPSVPLSDGAYGAFLLTPERLHQKDSPENAVLRSPGDLEALLERHHLPHSLATSLPPIDYERQMGVMVLHGISTRARRIQIVGVEPRPDGYVVHTVEWLSHFMPIGDPWVFDLVAIPRTDRPLHFLPPLEAAEGNTKFLHPEQNGRRADRLVVVPNGEVLRYPGRFPTAHPSSVKP